MAVYPKEKSKGNWVVRYDAGYSSVTGKRIQKQRSGFKTKKEALAFLRAVEEQKAVPDEKFCEEPSLDPFKDFVVEWFNTEYKLEVGETTFENRKYMLPKHLIPYFNTTPIGKITYKDLNAFYAQKVEKEKLSEKTVREMHHILSMAFQYGVEEGLLKANPAKKAKPPKPKGKEINPWTYDSVIKFLDQVEGTNRDAIYFLAVFSGMRRGELLGLKWTDINLGEGIISVQRSLAYTSKKGLFLKNPKTKSSRRRIEISHLVVEKLKEHKTKQDLHKKQMGNEYEDQDLVFPNIMGKLADPRKLLRDFYKQMSRAGVPRITFHDIRHTHATLLLLNGENPKVVQERLGHADISVTLNIYAHVLPGMQKKAADKMEEAYLKNKK